ncbi:YbaB/EbfC family nucleoid-associated protein [Natronoglycomyces albus]|uniref:Nucleoid-associated protein JQS30_13870 n=1 Tax=Natronoglycomyces albus TaxID=2811108 RepID=A0A895XRF2_9ACTN|nr:YbaB/EbfC family nucleoid-associated protein [Natronoglycomyces albus]QSB04840.1 YbaB/EbfC family nucleoid-associated protein [Natronoglycomyces albus]
MFPGGDMQSLLKQAQKMQEDYVQAQQELNESEVTASAGGGLVSATVSGAGELLGVKIDPKAVDPDDVEALEDLVLAAVQAANNEAKKVAEEKLGPISEALGGMGGGMGLPGM